MSLPFLTLNDVAITNKRILMREDFNVPIQNGVIQSDLRIRAALPGIRQALDANAQVLLMSHLGRPEPGNWQAAYSLQPVALHLQKLLKQNVVFMRDWLQQTKAMSQDKLILLENVRFLHGETENDPDLARKMASLCDVFFMDAFGSAHRAHASTVGVAEYVAIAVAGPLLASEVTALNQIMHDPKRPLLAIIGGAKISTKLDVLQSLVGMVDILIIGGGMANTLLVAQGFNVGASLCEHTLIPQALDLLGRAQQNNCEILLPTDVITQHGAHKNVSDIAENDQIMDVGAVSVQKFCVAIKKAATIIWNGPMGVFEHPSFANGTEQIALATAHSQAFTVAGGGDTLSAIDQLNLTSQFSYISTGGGAFLEYIEGKALPAITALINKRKNNVKTN